MIRYSANDLTKQVEELEKNFKEIQSKLKQSPGDFQQQTEQVMKVIYTKL